MSSSEATDANDTTVSEDQQGLDRAYQFRRDQLNRDAALRHLYHYDYQMLRCFLSPEAIQREYQSLAVGVFHPDMTSPRLRDESLLAPSEEHNSQRLQESRHEHAHRHVFSRRRDRRHHSSRRRGLSGHRIRRPSHPLDTRLLPTPNHSDPQESLAESSRIVPDTSAESLAEPPPTVPSSTSSHQAPTAITPGVPQQLSTADNLGQAPNACTSEENHHPKCDQIGHTATDCPHRHFDSEIGTRAFKRR